MRQVIWAVMLVASPALGQAVPAPVPFDGTLLEVTAEGHTTRVPDVAMIRTGVVTQGSTAAQAMADNAARVAGVLAALRKAGVAERDIRTATLSLSPQYRYADSRPPVLTGYQASNSVAVRFRDIARSGAILDALVAAGANQIDGPELSLDNPDAALDEARTDAMARARTRATLYAKAAGLQVVRIVSISESGQDAGLPMPMPGIVAMRAEAPRTQIVAGERDVTASLAVRFLLK